MKQDNDHAYSVDIDKAWNVLYTRLENEQLLIDKTAASPRRKRKISFQWMAVAAAVCLGIIFSIFYFSQLKSHSLIVQQNREKSGTLVATLNDGSIVYLAPDASITYSSTFTDSQRKVKLNGNALFYVAKDEKRPFIITTNEKITIQVVGTIFVVQSSSVNPFELSVKQGKVNVHANDSSTAFSVEAGETVQLKTEGLTKSRIMNYRIFTRFTDKMSFKDEKLNNIVHAINTLYGYPTIVTDESINNRTLTVTFENDSVASMTELICMALNLVHINKQDTIVIQTNAK